jgi:hypothetical protein
MIYNPIMNTAFIISAIDQEIAKLIEARRLLSTVSTGSTNFHVEKRRPGRPKGNGVNVTRAKRKSTMSPEARARISAAQKKRWAKTKRA